MNESILTSVKKMLGIAEEYEHFDPDLLMHINSALAVLTQLGVGPTSGLMISDKTTTWNDLIFHENKLQLVKTYVFLKVKLMFDPPLSSSVLECYKTQISELEWRLNVAAETDASSSGSDAEEYTGTYTVTPKAKEAQVLETADKLMKDDVVVNQIPFYQVSNNSGGYTSYIAREA